MKERRAVNNGSMSGSAFVKKISEFSTVYHGPFVTHICPYDHLSSTNIILHSLANKGAEEGTVVIAQTQRQGRGRFDRVWQSPKGGVYLSLLLRPKAPVERAPLLTFVAALAVSQTIRSYNVTARIKWPNDVLVDGKKIAGILLESEASGPLVSYVIIGIGVNLNTDLALLSGDVRTSATSLQKELGSEIDYEEFLSTFFEQFDRCYRLFSASLYEQIIDAWKQQSDVLGRRIRVQTPNGFIQGIAVDVDESGFLMVKTTERGTIRVTSGDCTVIDGS